MNLAKQNEEKVDMEVLETNFYNKVLIDFFNKNNKYNKILFNMIMNDYIKTLVDVNKDAVESIATLEETVKNYPITDDKSKANFGNLCILLNGYRNILKATDCLLINENVLKDSSGNYYQKIEDEDENVIPPTTEGKPGSDYDVDKKE